MKVLGRVYQLFIFLLIVSLPTSAQRSGINDSTRQKFFSAAREIMAHAHFCTLISMDEADHPVGRIVEPFEPDSNLVVWIGTNSLSRKVQQIKKNPVITLFYFDPSSYAYVSIQGKAELKNDSASVNLYWKDEWLPFYPNNREYYLLIKFTPTFLEILSPEQGFSGDRMTWRTPSLKLQ
jgi:general stress protein 26